MKEILFATGNPRKIIEANNTLEKYNIKVKPIGVDINEIQHFDPAEIAKAKARSAYEAANSPVVVSDTSWEIPALGGFPGGYMKDIATWLEPEDWLNIMAPHEDKTIICHEHLAYFDGDSFEHFYTSYRGKFINDIRGKSDKSESFERCVVMYGDKTMAEQSADGGVASAGERLEHWEQFGKWYSNRSQTL